MAKQNVIILAQDQVLVVKGRKKLGTPEATAIVAHLRAQIAIRKGGRPSKYAHRKILLVPGQLLSAPFPNHIVLNTDSGQASLETSSQEWICEDGLYDHLVLKFPLG